MVNVELLVVLIPLLPLVSYTLIAFNVNRLSKATASGLACGSIALSFICSVLVFVQLLATDEAARSITVNLFNWISVGNFSATMSFLVDPLSSIFLLIITGVGFLIHVYSTGYMHEDPAYNRFFSYLNLFVFFMLLLVMGSNYLLMFVGWEGVGLCSYLLIGFWFKNHDYASAANKAFIMNRIGDLGLILGVILIFVQFGSIEYGVVFSQTGNLAPGTLAVTLITVLLFVGAMGKSAQIPLYTWLPDAMAGPTPVSALIHAATMVTAGIYMVARNNILYALSPIAMELVMVVGVVTALLAAIIALAQNDIKKVLAYSTVSQLGLMFVALGSGAFTAGIFHVGTHAFFKALLFLGAGSVIHALHHEQDIRNMGGLKKYLPVTYFTFLVGVLAIAGIPPFAGFFSKDEILAHAFAVNPVVWALALLTSLLTVFYMFRLLFLTFFGAERSGRETLEHIHESPKSITLPLLVLAALSVAGGFVGIPEVLGGSHWLKQYLQPVFADSAKWAETHHLSHSTEYMLMGIVLGLTAVMIVAAYVLFVSKKAVPVAEGSSLSPAHRLIYNKFFIDELYHRIITQPVYWLSSKVEVFIERTGIDGFVNGMGNLVMMWSKDLRMLQVGNIGFYVFAMVIGVVLLMVMKFFI